MHPFQKHREDKARHVRVKHILKADGGEVAKDQSRYGDDRQAGFKTPNQDQAWILQNPPRTKNTPGFDTDTSSTRSKRIQKAEGGTVGPTPQNLRNKQRTDRVSGRAGAGERYDTSFVGTKKEN